MVRVPAAVLHAEQRPRAEPAPLVVLMAQRAAASPFLVRVLRWPGFCGSPPLSHPLGASCLAPRLTCGVAPVGCTRTGSERCTRCRIWLHPLAVVRCTRCGLVPAHVDAAGAVAFSAEAERVAERASRGCRAFGPDPSMPAEVPGRVLHLAEAVAGLPRDLYLVGREPRRQFRGRPVGLVEQEPEHRLVGRPHVRRRDGIGQLVPSVLVAHGFTARRPRPLIP